jgi:spermidine/putrescine transport system substrate-binding protein
MSDQNEPIKILAPPAAAERISQRVSRRRFMGGAAGVAAIAGSGLLSACGDDEPDDTGASGEPAGEIESELNMFTWGEYNSPKVIKDFEGENDLKFTLDSYNSNEQLIAKLTAAGGTSGYDLVVPTGPFVPAMVANELLQELDLDRLTNFGNLEAQYTDQEWDPGNKYSICKDWGTTGYAYDQTKIDREMATWQDFLDVAMNEASGNFSMLDAPDNVVGTWLWANDIDWMTEDPAQLDECEDFLINQLAPHVKAFDSYPGGGAMQNGTFAMVHVWNGDARLGIIQSDPDTWKWVLPGPRTEIWMDTYVIPVGAPHPNAAYAWMDYLLQPEVSLKELEYIGYHTGVKDIQPMAEEAGLPLLDLVFFTEEQVATMEPGAVNEAQDRRVEIYNKFKAAAGG